jgi:type I restriction enzyme S subunit
MSEGNGLPKGWAELPLGQCGDWYGGGTPSKADDDFWRDGTIPWISPKDMKSLHIADSEDHITDLAIEQTNVKPYPPGTVLVVIRSGILARTLPVAVADVTATMNQDLKGIRPAPWLDALYLAYLLRSREISILRSCSKDGTTVPSIDTSALHAVLIPFPPLPEQHRIVEKIEELCSDLDAGVASLQRAKANLKRYRASVLKSAVEGRLTDEWRKEHPQTEDGQMLLDRILRERREKWERDQLAQFKKKGKEPPKNWQSKYEEPSTPDTSELPELPEGWVWARVEQVSWVRSGQTPPDIRDHLRASGDFPWFTVGDMNHEANTTMMNHADKFLSQSSAESLGMHLHPPRTIIFPKRGGAIATNKKRQLATVGSYDLNTMGIIPTDESHSYIWLWFLGVDLRHFSDGSNVPQINHNDIEPLPIPLPPLAEQEQIVALVEERLSQIDSAEKTIDSELIRSKRLRQSILKRAFEGKLVPQDPKDEPASVLLGRIKSSREQEQPKKTKKVKAK